MANTAPFSFNFSRSWVLIDAFTREGGIIELRFVAHNPIKVPAANVVRIPVADLEDSSTTVADLGPKAYETAHAIIGVSPERYNAA